MVQERGMEGAAPELEEPRGRLDLSFGRGPGSRAVQEEVCYQSPPVSRLRCR